MIFSAQSQSDKLRLASRLLVSLALCPAIILCNTASANTNESSSSIETISVVGQRSYYDSSSNAAARVDLPILETPQSIFVINSELIEDQQAFRFDQVLQNDSSVQKANNFLGAYSSYQIRGFELSNGSNYFRDGRSFFHLAAPPVEVLEKVEVLKGPSSVLYGTLAPGGIINMTPKRPNREFHTSIKATAGSNDFSHYHIDHGGPITDDGAVRYRINAAYEDSGSFRKFADGSDFETERTVLSAALEWDINDKTVLRFNGDYTNDNRPQDIGVISPDGTFSSVDYDLILNQPWSQYDSDVSNLFVEVTHQLNDVIQLRGGMSFQDYERDRYDNQFRGLPDDLGNINIRARHRINRWEYTTYFADMMAEFDTGPLSHMVLVGIDQKDVDRDNNETARNVIFTTNIYDPEIVDDPHIATSKDKNIGKDQYRGITVQDVISIGDKWRVMLGGRYDDIESSFSIAGTPSEGQPQATNFTPRAGLVYLPTPNFSVYTSYSESFEPNAAVSSGYVNAGQALDPTLGKQLEAGIKWEALGGKLLSSASIFTIERTDAPVEDILANRIEQRGTQKHDGLDFSVTGLVNDNITVHGSATYLDAEYTVTDDPDLVGNTPYGVPDVALSFTTEYEFLQGKLQGLSLQASVFYESERPVDDANSYDLDGYTRFDAGIKYVLTRGSGNDMIFRLSAMNLTDEQYYKARGPLAINPEPSREVRGSIELQF
ncbi:TonB-dependent siderophore receptor [Pseudomaricurvus sp.]|uniref:TonB-dependent siderophore receptor n=1 Tax=Pseudomaricurvus sp. TaxID=2004510 RepID=UPI003F6AE987